MSMFRKAERAKARLRMAVIGPSGSGKTYSALLIAFGLGGKVVVIDSENGSADLYASLGEYDVYTMTKPYEPEKLIAVIKEAEKEGYGTIVIDSLTHYWAGEGGLLERHDKIGGNSYTAWGKVTPVHQRMIEAINTSTCHVISTMRSKTEYVLAEKNGKQVPEKVGMAPVQRDGAEYEYTVVFNINMNHTAEATKDRTGLFDGRFFTPDIDTGKQLLEWLESGVDKPMMIRKDTQHTIATEAKERGISGNTMSETIKEKYGKDNSSELTEEEALDLLKFVQTIEPEVKA